MALEDCRFWTDRLDVGDWSRLRSGDSEDRMLSTFLVSLLSEAVTRDLPPGWQGTYDHERASSWFVERRNEGAALLVMDRSDGRPVGILIVAESENIDGHVDIRLGYLIHESAWGKGFATEVVAGFVDWCRIARTVRSISGGVSASNAASTRVLQKNGFVPANSAFDPHGEVMYTLSLAP